MKSIIALILCSNLLGVGSLKNTNKPPTTRVLITATGYILSTGDPLQFDEIGLKFLGEPTYKGNDEIIDGTTFSHSLDYWAMVKRNQKEAEATAHIQVKDGILYHDGKRVNFGGLTVRWMDNAVFWLDWVVGPGLTSKSGQASLDNPEPHELLYYNFKTLRGGAVYVGGKGASGEVRILTK